MNTFVNTFKFRKYIVLIEMYMKTKFHILVKHYYLI